MLSLVIHAEYEGGDIAGNILKPFKYYNILEYNIIYIIKYDIYEILNILYTKILHK